MRIKAGGCFSAQIFCAAVIVFLNATAYCQDTANADTASLSAIVESVNLGMSFQDYMKLRPRTERFDFDQRDPSVDPRPGDGSYSEQIVYARDNEPPVTSILYSVFSKGRLTIFLLTASGPESLVTSYRGEVLHSATTKLGSEAEAFLHEAKNGNSDKPDLRPVLRWRKEDTLSLLLVVSPRPSPVDETPVVGFFYILSNRDYPALPSMQPAQESDEEVHRALEACGLADTLRELGIKIAVSPVVAEK